MEPESPSGESEAGAPPPSVDTEDARLGRLERLATLHEKGVLSDDELAAEKRRLFDADD